MLATPAEKREFVQTLCANVLADITKKIESGAVPVEWDGIELRQLLADKFREETYRSNSIAGKRRIHDYRNTVLVNNL